jgi:hypothetical protein
MYKNMEPNNKFFKAGVHLRIIDGKIFMFLAWAYAQWRWDMCFLCVPIEISDGNHLYVLRRVHFFML